MRVGARLSVFWCEEGEWYRGVVQRVSSQGSRKGAAHGTATSVSSLHLILYEDGESHWHDLRDFDYRPSHRSTVAEGRQRSGAQPMLRDGASESRHAPGSTSMQRKERSKSACRQRRSTMGGPSKLKRTSGSRREPEEGLVKARQ